MVLHAMGAHRIELANANAGQGKPVKCYNCNRIGHIARNFLDEEELLFLAGEQANTFDADVDNQPVQDLALNEDNIFQADECDAFDSDVDDEPTAQSIFMANLSSAGPANPQAGPSNASILSKVHILENAIDHSVTNQDEHKIHNEVQQANVIDSTSVDMGNSNVIPYEQYLSVDNISVVPSCASSALNDVCVSSDNDAFVPHDPIATELKIYKEQVAIYEQRAKFELTEREQRMDDQMRMLIQNRNKTEENLKKELHSVKLQLNSTMENNKIIEETVTTLKQEFKQKESKFLTDFSNLKHLNDKLENKLHSQDQSIQTVHMMLNPTQVYDQKTKTALELLKTHHVPVIVPSSEEDLELAETTRNKLHAKMNDSACVEKRVNITPPNYSKENFMATFTPQTQLTPEQVFWSIDLEKRKAEELKANAPPLPVLPPATVYPPNTPVHLVPRTLPTTSQVNIGLYVITQLFWDFEKTCKKRITPTGITEGERGFEQTKRCYLTEVIPFFNLLKEHFDGVQKSLVTEVRAMKAVFENLEAEVDQNEIDLKSGEIERKNLLITNENLLAECLSKDVFYTATDSVLNVSRFSDMHDAFTIAQKRIADLESENFNLRNKIQNDDHDLMIKHFSKHEVEHFNLQLKYQNLKERFVTSGEDVSDPESPAPKPSKGAKPKTTKKPTSTQQTKPKTKPLIAKTTKSTPSQPPKPKPAPAKPQEKKRKWALDVVEAPSQAKRSKVGVSKKRMLHLRDEFIDEGVPSTEPRVDDEEAIMQKVLEESMKDAYPTHRGPLPPVVFWEPDSGKLQLLPEVQGKGKEKVGDEQAGKFYLTFRLPRKKNPAEQFIFQRRTPVTTKPSVLFESSSLYAELGLTDSGTESDEEVSPEMSAQGQEEGQGGTNPGDAGVSQTPSSHVVHAGPNLDHMDLGIAEASSQPNTKQIDDEFTATTYPKVQENLKLPTEGEEDEPEKTNTEAEVQSMVTVPIHQDTSYVPLMTTPVIDITDPQSDSTTIPASMPTTTATATETTTTTNNIANLVDANQALEERLDKQGNRIHQLETQDLSRLIREQAVEFIDSQEIDRKIEESVKEVVTASVQHAMRAPLCARFKDLPTSDMKEILLQHMLEENYDKGHEDHKMAFKALQKSIIRDKSEQFDADKAKERTKKKRASGPTGTSDSTQDPRPPPPSSTTNRGDQSHSSAALGSFKTVASTAYIAWTTTTFRLEPAASSVPEDVLMHEESDFKAQDMGSDDEDSGNRHIPKASTIASIFVSPLENSLLSQTGDIGVFIDWFCKKQGITELIPEHLEGPAYEVVKAFHPDVIHQQFQMEECHKLLTNQVDKGLLRYNVSRPLLLGGPPGQVTIQTKFFFNKDLEYLRFGHKGDRLALSITKMKAASYPDVKLEQMWFKRQQFYIERYSADTNRRAIIRTHMRILSVVRIEVFSLYGYDCMKKIVLRRADNQEYTIVESNFKDLYTSDFEDLYLLNLQGHLNHLQPKDKKILSTTVNLWIRNLVIKKWVEDFQLGIESYQTQLNLTKPRWEATSLEFMHDYKILDSPRVVVFRDKYGMQMIM
ncbi:E-beta-farnesene synthase [Tanacetum coccineum]